MRRALAALATTVLVACTPAAETPGGASSPEPPSGPGQEPIAVPVIATSGDDALERSFLDGMALARERVNRAGGVGGRPLELPIDEATAPRDLADRLRVALTSGPPAILVAGSAEAVADARPEIEAARTPVIVLGGDPYTGRLMHRYLFQTSIPARWQARVVAEYVLEDRRADLVAILTQGGSAGSAVGEAFDDAFAAEGAAPPSRLPFGGALPQMVDAAAGADAVVIMLPPARLARAVDALRQAPDPPRLVLSSAAFPRPGPVPPGSVICASYTWAGWADMLPRVHAFRETFAARFGAPPSGLEQEGYDAVMAMADALERTGGEGGDALVTALEGFRDETYSSVPVRLGPDDHVFAEQSHLGLFAVTDRTGAPDAEMFGEVPWRPIMRTFTTDGEKVNLLDRDKRIFFPFWRPKRPTPKYRRSEYGIVSRRTDPLH